MKKRPTANVTMPDGVVRPFYATHIGINIRNGYVHVSGKRTYGYTLLSDKHTVFYPAT